MLKSYAVALVLATTAPVAVKSVESVQAPVKNQTVSTTTADTTKSGLKNTRRW